MSTTDRGPQPFRFTTRLWLAWNVYAAVLCAAAAVTLKVPAGLPEVRGVAAMLGSLAVVVAWQLMTRAFFRDGPAREAVLWLLRISVVFLAALFTSAPFWAGRAFFGRVAPPPLPVALASLAVTGGLLLVALENALRGFPARCPHCGWRALFPPARRAWQTGTWSAPPGYRAPYAYRWCASCGARVKLMSRPRPGPFGVTLAGFARGWEDASGPDDHEAYWQRITAPRPRRPIGDSPLATLQLNPPPTTRTAPRMNFRKLADILGMIKFSHTLFALPFALLGAALAARRPEGGWAARPQDWLGILLCMAFARSAAMAFNRLVDRRIDARNPRTANRHLPAGTLSAGSVAWFTAATSAGFVASTLLFWPNRLPLILSVPVLLWLLGYSYAKRFTSLAHFWLGAALMMAPAAAWIALRGGLDWPPALLGLAVLFWVAGFDIIYACQDAAFDREAGLHSIPARLGVRRALRLAAACHAATVAALVGLGLAYPLGPVYFAGVVAVAALLVYEHAIVRPDDLSRVNVAFLQVNVAISLGLLAVGVADLLL